MGFVNGVVDRLHPRAALTAGVHDPAPKALPSPRQLVLPPGNGFLDLESGVWDIESRALRFLPSTAAFFKKHSFKYFRRPIYLLHQRLA